MLEPPPDFTTEKNSRSVADIRAWLVTELSRTLKVDPSSIDTAGALYSLGADSVTAIGITGALAGWLIRDLPATLMWDYPSIDAIAEALADSAEPAVAAARPGMITLQPHGDRCPLFCFPGAGGHSTTFAALAAHIGPEHPCFGLTVPGLNGEQKPLEQVEEIAAAMLKSIRLVQPKGPYQLAGYSFGGLLAYEAARQLRAAGEVVSLLAIYDTFTPDGLILRPRWQRLFLHARVIATQPGRREYLRQQLKSRRLAREQKSADDEGGAIAMAHLRENLATEVELTNNRAIARYRPPPYADPVVLFRATERKMEAIFYKIDHSSNGWGALTDGRVRIVDLPGSHASILSMENARVAAERLRPYLSEEYCSLAR
jgi:thioesterase domain-containing protein/acyl carrier protein